MADNYLENHYDDYLKKKEAWIRRKKRMPKHKRQIERPEDEAL